MAKNKDNDFELVNLPEAARDPEITAEDFTLQQADKTIHEQKFQTKPTTFFKDSLKRFSKNKSSVVAAYILGFLVLLSIFVPIFNKNDVSNAANPALNNLEPKLFENFGGFWDGTKRVKHRPVDPNNDFYPDPTLFLHSGVKNMSDPVLEYTDVPNIYGTGGYVQFGYYGNSGSEVAYLDSTNPKDVYAVDQFTLDLSVSQLKLTQFVAADENMVIDDGKGSNPYSTGTIPENFKLGLTGLDFVYYDSEAKQQTIKLIEPASKQTIGLDVAPVDINATIIAGSGGKTSFDSFFFRLVCAKPDGAEAGQHVCSLVKSFVITTQSTDEKEKRYFSTTKDKETLIDGICFIDPMGMMNNTFEVGRGSSTRRNYGYWKIDNTVKFLKEIYSGKSYFRDFTYDSYTATLGQREWAVDSDDIKKYVNNGWLDCNIQFVQVSPNVYVVDEGTFYFDVLNADYCPVCPIDPETFDFSRFTYLGVNPSDEEDYIYQVSTDVIYYKYLYANGQLDECKMPTYLFGTDKTGRDMFKYVFEGLRNSLLLGLGTFVICFLFGLIYGSVSGYFGGAVDLVMERVTDILSGVPWIVVMTIVILHLGSNLWTFLLALCLTGWIGTAATTRTQFYRFRGREYVLASRTLGASDARLIAKHILPNALGTIITGAVLMIPSVIFSEATISYLGLGFRNLSSLGVILSNNQSELTNHPYQLIFPSVVIALVMISFNLFGNGLRDAINPSLKGEDQ